MKYRIGIIGLGDIARKVYLPLLSADENVEIIGVSSRTPAAVETIAGRYRIPGKYDCVEGLLEAGPDAVFVHTSTEAHYEVVMACLKRGVPVYVDKPLSYDYRESETMARFALERQTLLAVGFNRRFAPLYVRAREWMEEAGGFEWCAAAKHRLKLQHHSAKHTLYDDLIHMLDLLLWLGGDDADPLHYIERTNDDGRLLCGAGSLAFPGHSAAGTRSGQFSMVRRAGTDLERLELHGGGRSVIVTNMEAAELHQKDELPQAAGFGSWDTIIERRGFAGAVRHFLASLQDGGSCSIRADRVLPVHRLIERLSSVRG
ncbi:Putative oxidoreductase YceM [Paenibacillus konkukensis]|uniref:Oxidoreductase YceM n=1 Tax=Paenibacillus konkukensis TaxID=2020716 RepID=A0ABY4RPI2_9BACL|nr:Gfo/Idh/MocA family oxidoreductase [Paenibacillus konkukensis]UQZ83860.1 Putative oxidoreductase YceM [Paenibacillus konkukensis]